MSGMISYLFRLLDRPCSNTVLVKTEPYEALTWVWGCMCNLLGYISNLKLWMFILLLSLYSLRFKKKKKRKRKKAGKTLTVLQLFFLCSSWCIFSMNWPPQVSTNNVPCPYILWGFPGGAVVKYLPASAGEEGDTGSVPGSGRFPGGGHGNQLQYSCLENSMGRGVWRVTVQGDAKSWTQLKLLSMQ